MPKDNITEAPDATTASVMGAYQKEALAEYRIRLLNGAWVGGCEWVGGRVCVGGCCHSLCNGGVPEGGLG